MLANESGVEIKRGYNGGDLEEMIWEQFLTPFRGGEEQNA